MSVSPVRSSRCSIHSVSRGRGSRAPIPVVERVLPPVLRYQGQRTLQYWCVATSQVPDPKAPEAGIVRHCVRGSLIAAALTGALAGCQQGQSLQAPPQTVQGGDASRGPAAIAFYGCGSCHVVPGVPGARGSVGPPLTGFAARAYIAGRAVNEPETLVRFILVPQSVDPETVMPITGIGQQEARDVAAYLYTLER